MDCPRCKTALNKDPYRGADAALQRRPTLERIKHIAGVEIDHCPSCSGVYLDHRELEKIQDAAASHAPELVPPTREQRVWARARENARPLDGIAATDEASPLVCPSCGGEMAERDYGFGSEVSIDTCIECRGVWLDFGELEALEEVFR